MAIFRRNRQKGGMYFFTVTLHNRKSQVLTDHIDLLKTAFSGIKKEHPFSIQSIVILPEHLHTIWELPFGDDYSTRWRKIKRLFTRQLLERGARIEKNNRDEYFLWQKRYWEHTIRNAKDYERHVNYIHYNPVKHGLVQRVRDWPHSSFHAYLKQGLLPEHWGGDIKELGGDFGE